MVSMGTWRYLKEVYKASKSEVAKELGSAKGGTVVLLIAIVATSIVLAIAAYVGFESGFAQMWNDLRGLFLGEAILLVSLWLGSCVVALFRMPATAANRDFAKDEQIKTLTKSEKPEVGKLAKLRTAGVKERNSGANVSNQDQLGAWIKQYEIWNAKMLRLAKKLSPGTADWLTTLDTMPLVPPIAPKVWVDDEHLRYARVWSEKLQRLDIVLRKHLGLGK